MIASVGLPAALMLNEPTIVSRNVLAMVIG